MLDIQFKAVCTDRKASLESNWRLVRSSLKHCIVGYKIILIIQIVGIPCFHVVNEFYCGNYWKF